MNRSRCACALTVGLGAVSIAGSIARGGPLNPPAGAVSPTMKTLDQVEPRTPINATTTPGDADAMFVITEPGSFYLEGPVTGAPGRDGIRVDASNVSIDGMGFPMTLVGGGILDFAIFTSASHNVSIRNVTCSGWPVRAFGTQAGRYEGITVDGTQTSGLSVGPGSVVRGCTVRNATGAGIQADDGSSIENCAVIGTTGSGINAEDGCVVANSSSRENTGAGFMSNRQNTFTGCASSANDGDGFAATNGTSVFDACVAANNGEFGFDLGGVGNTITECSAVSNTSGQIRVQTQSLVARNTCRNATNSPGIIATSDGNRIEDNLVSFIANPAYSIQGTGNFVVRNYSTNNSTDYVIGPGNFAGAVVTFPNGGTITSSTFNVTAWTNFATD